LPHKEDLVFDLKPLPDDLKYAYIDDKKIYPVIISSKLSGKEEERLLEILRKHRGAMRYTLNDLKGISPTICQHAINIEPDAKPVVEHQRRLIPKMKEVVRNEVLNFLTLVLFILLLIVDGLIMFIVFQRKEELLLCLMRIMGLFLKG
jgi:hypothetical protein